MGFWGFFPVFFSLLSFDQRENLMTCHLILLKFPVISVMNRLFGVTMVSRKLHYCRIRGEEIACSDMSPRCVFGSDHQLPCFGLRSFESLFITRHSQPFLYVNHCAAALLCFPKCAIKLKWIGLIQLNSKKKKIIANEPQLDSGV